MSYLNTNIISFVNYLAEYLNKSSAWWVCDLDVKFVNRIFINDTSKNCIEPEAVELSFCIDNSYFIKKRYSTELINRSKDPKEVAKIEAQDIELDYQRFAK